VSVHLLPLGGLLDALRGFEAAGDGVWAGLWAFAQGLEFAQRLPSL
jgi:hypothetical protein